MVAKVEVKVVAKAVAAEALAATKRLMATTIGVEEPPTHRRVEVAPGLPRGKQVQLRGRPEARGRHPPVELPHPPKAVAAEVGAAQIEKALGISNGPKAADGVKRQPAEDAANNGLRAVGPKAQMLSGMPKVVAPKPAVVTADGAVAMKGEAHQRAHQRAHRRPHTVVTQSDSL